MLRQTFEELKVSGNLPSPPGVVMRILKLSQSDSHSADEISAAIMTDSVLTGRLLKLANSASAAGAQPATTVSEATMRLGVRAVMNVALGLSLVSSNRTGRCETFDYDRYWSNSLARAVAAQNIARQMRGLSPAEGYVMGLLCDIGRLALASIYPTEYAVILENPESKVSSGLARLEEDQFAIDHTSVAACMIEDWGLPESFARAIQVFERADNLQPGENRESAAMARVLYCAHTLTSVCLDEHDPTLVDYKVIAGRLESVRTMLGIEPEQFTEFCKAIQSEWIEWGKILDVPTGRMAMPDEIHRRATNESQDDVTPQPVASEVTALGRSEPGPEGAKRLRILAVDDDPTSLRLLEATLKKSGNDVITASNGEQALKLALELSPQVVIADWMMPEMDGLELCKSLRRIDYGRNVFFLLLTGRTEEDRIVEAFDAGVDDYVVKPFNSRVLLARIKGGQRVVELQERVASDRKMIMRQVAELGLMTRKLRTAALTDVLTELPNRRYAMKRLETDWDASGRTESPLSVVMLDIDHFKKVNDTYGHDIGDVVLKETARILRSSTRQGEEASRLGGEEFFVVCPNSTESQAAVCAERLRGAIERNVIKAGGFEGNVTVSLGVAQRMPGMANFDALIKAADAAVYASKAAGRNRVALASATFRKAKSA
ncbi:MAG: diguanylate cyclase [Planctomycetes bacterium]|nr:diguanylate cyclase [Planctomycetota bacterium]